MIIHSCRMHFKIITDWWLSACRSGANQGVLLWAVSSRPASTVLFFRFIFLLLFVEKVTKSHLNGLQIGQAQKSTTAISGTP